jgi:hypothetical protein
MLQNDALSTDDIVNGVGLAFALVLVAYLLPSSSTTGVVWRSTADDFEPLLHDKKVLNDKDDDDDDDNDVVNVTEDTCFQDLDESTASHKRGGTVFGEASWKEISRPENYIYYNNQLREKKNGTRRVPNDESRDEVSSSSRKEKRWVLPGLLLLFVPIFSFEIVLTISRQLLCDGNPFTQLGWAQDLCIPHIQ